MRNCILSLSMLCLLCACTSGKAVDNSGQKTNGQGVSAPASANEPASNASQYALEISPEQATKNTTISAVPRGFSILDVTVEWLVNGMPLDDAVGYSFRPTGTQRGDVVQARTVIDGRELVSNKVEIRNTPPELTKVKLMPEVFKPGDKLNVEAAAADSDGDPVTINYEWTRNGEPAGTDAVIEGDVKRGDKITVKITPSDGEDEGPWIKLKRDITNMPPTISDHKEYTFDGKTYSYQVKASDADDDSLVYSLKASPQGMTIGEDGLVTWEVPRGFRGETTFTVSVADGHGGEALQSFNVKIGPAKRSRR